MNDNQHVEKDEMKQLLKDPNDIQTNAVLLVFEICNPLHKPLIIDGSHKLNINEQIKILNDPNLYSRSNHSPVYSILSKLFSNLQSKESFRVLSEELNGGRHIERITVNKYTPKHIALSLLLYLIRYFETASVDDKKQSSLIYWSFTYYFYKFCTEQGLNGDSLQYYIYQSNKDSDAICADLIRKICQQYSLRASSFTAIKHILRLWINKTFVFHEWDPLTLLCALYTTRYKTADHLISNELNKLNIEQQLNILSIDHKKRDLSEVVSLLTQQLPQITEEQEKKLEDMLQFYVASCDILPTITIDEWSTKHVPMSFFLFLINYFMKQAIDKKHTLFYWLFGHCLDRFCQEKYFDAKSLPIEWFRIHDHNNNNNNNTDNIKQFSQQLVNKICDAYLSCNLWQMTAFIKSSITEMVVLWFSDEVQRSQAINNQKHLQPRFKSWRGIMFDHLISHKTNAKHLMILARMLCDEEKYDTESLQHDVSQQPSNILLSLDHLETCALIKEYARETEALEKFLNPGILYWYWPYYEARQFDENKEYNSDQLTITGIYIRAKYANIKEECFESEAINVIQWNKVVNRATNVMKMDDVKEIKSANRDNELHYNISRGTPLTKQHVMVVCLFCDFDHFQEKYLSTFKAQHISEPISSIVKRHQSFSCFSKRLREIIQYFGDNVYSHSHGIFYYGVDRLVTLQSFSISYNYPWNVSCHIDVVMMFAGQNGIVIQLQNDGDYESRNHLRSFDVSWISYFSKEEERIFFDPGLSVRISSTKQNFVQAFHALYLLDCILSGTNMEGATIDSKDTDRLYFLALFGDTVDDNIYIDKYIYDIFYSFCAHKTRITVNIHMLDLYFRDLSDIIYGSNKKEDRNLVKPNIINRFRNLQKITLITTSLDGSSSYSLSLEILLRLLSNRVPF